MIALVLEVIFSSILSGFILRVSLSISTKTGLKPAIRIEFPTDAKLNQRLGWLALNENDLDTAESYFRKSIMHDPESANTFRLLGSVLLKQGRYKEAERELLQSLKLNPDSVWGLIQLGEVYMFLDKIDAAIDAYEKAILLDPTNSRAIQQLQLLHQGP